MNTLSLSSGIIAALGAEGTDPRRAVCAALDPDAGLTILPPEPMLEPALTLGQNYRLVKRYSLPERGETLARLLELSGLGKKGWDRPLRKDMDGERQLWKCMLTLAMAGNRVLLPRALEGMNSGQREALAAMLAAWTEDSGCAILTVNTLKEALALPGLRQLWLVKGERVLPLGRETLEAYRGRERKEALFEELWKEAEG